MTENLLRNSKGQFIKGRFKKGHKTWIKGKHVCCNTGRTHFKKGQKPLRTFPKGEHPWNYKGGISSEREKFCGTQEYKKWRQDVYKKNRYECRFCGTGGRKIRAHHIKEFHKFPELRLDPNNGITVCDSCHKIIHYKYQSTWPHCGIGEYVNF